MPSGIEGDIHLIGWPVNAAWYPEWNISCVDITQLLHSRWPRRLSLITSSNCSVSSFEFVGAVAKIGENAFFPWVGLEEIQLVQEIARQNFEAEIWTDFHASFGGFPWIGDSWERNNCQVAHLSVFWRYRVSQVIDLQNAVYNIVLLRTHACATGSNFYYRLVYNPSFWSETTRFLFCWTLNFLRH